MSKLTEIQIELSSLTEGEKAQLLQWIASDLGDSFPGIDSSPGVCGGEACITRTRIPVWVLERLRQQGVEEAEILANFPTLRAQDLVNAWAFARRFSAQIEKQIKENEEA